MPLVVILLRTQLLPQQSGKPHPLGISIISVVDIIKNMMTFASSIGYCFIDFEIHRLFL